MYFTDNPEYFVNSVVLSEFTAIRQIKQFWIFYFDFDVVISFELNQNILE